MSIVGRGQNRLETTPVFLEERLIGQALAAAGIAAAVLVLTIQCCRYLFLGAYFDHIEGNVVISGWQYAHGEPLYAMQQGAPRLATFYGPIAYLAPLPALLVLGADVTISKFTSTLAVLATVISMGCYFRRNTVRDEWRDGLFFLIAALLVFIPVSFWVRLDPLETLIVAAAVISTRSSWRPIWVGICVGLAVNLERHPLPFALSRSL